MKYLKKFNEELRPQTYRSAAAKLLKQSPFNKERADDLRDWAEKKEQTQNSEKWEKMKAETSKFGTYNLSIENNAGAVRSLGSDGEDFVGRFHPYISFDRDAFLDEYEYNKEQGGNFDMGLYFFLGSVPADQETLDKCIEIMPDPEFANGFFWTNSIGIQLYFESGSVKINDVKIDEYDDSLTGSVSVADRKSAQVLKNVLVKMFSEPNLGYPSGYNDFDSFYEMFEAKVLAEAGLSSDYGFSMEAIADFLKGVSANKFIG
jgi:hypothetical protein